MDPVSAAGFASSIITFIDFSYKIIQGSITLYSSASGVSAENAAIGTIVDDLRNITDVIAQPPTPETDSPHWRELRKLAADCNGISKELAVILENLKRKEGNKAWRSLEAAWKSMRKSKEIAAIEELLQMYRVQLLLRINLILSDNQTSVQRQLDELRKGDAAYFDNTINELTEIRRTITELGTKFLAEAGQSMQISSHKDGETADLGDLRAELALVVRSLEGIPRRTPADLLVLNRLYFGTLYARVDNIHDAEFGTFSWFLKDDEESNVDKSSEDQENHDEGLEVGDETIDEELNVDKRSQEQRDLAEASTARKTFQKWLVSGSGVFHISGKAGSGKSTLMKLLSLDPELRNKLDTWADDKKLVFATFYFWISGDDQQNSLEGLYRSLLFETLSECPDLVKTVFPNFWRAARTSHAEVTAWNLSPFRLPELREAMKNVIKCHGHRRHRFCFFIDGLDEFQGDSNDHWELAQVLRQWTESPDVKLCVSSRPHQEFLEVFDPRQRLHLHQLTNSDIRRFVTESLAQERDDEVDRTFLDETVSSITYNAQGVFLWARLVVRSLLEGIRRHESPRKLQQRVSQTPGDLEALFRQLFKDIAPGDRHISDQMLCIAAMYPAGVSTLLLSWLEDLADPAFPFESQLPTLSKEEFSRRLRAAEAQIKSLSGGLLETQTVHRWVGRGYRQVAVFFHRTAHDFLLQPDIRSAMEKRLGGSFDKNEAFQRLFIADLMSTDHKYRTSINHELRYGYLIRCKLSTQTLKALAEELDKQNKDELTVRASFIKGPMPTVSHSVSKSVHSVESSLSLLHILVNGRPDHHDAVDELRKAPRTHLQQEGLCLLFSACVGSLILRSTDPPSRLMRDMVMDGERMDDLVGMRRIDKSVAPWSWDLVPGWVAFLYCFGYIWRPSQGALPGVSWNVLEVLLSTLPHLDIRWEIGWAEVVDGEVEKFKLSPEPFSYTLEDLIMWAKPPNMDMLLTEMVRRRSRSGWLWPKVLASWMTPRMGSSQRLAGSELAFSSDVVDKMQDDRITRIWAGEVCWKFPPDPWFRVW